MPEPRTPAGQPAAAPTVALSTHFCAHRLLDHVGAGDCAECKRQWERVAWREPDLTGDGGAPAISEALLEASHCPGLHLEFLKGRLRARMRRSKFEPFRKDSARGSSTATSARQGGKNAMAAPHLKSCARPHRSQLGRQTYDRGQPAGPPSPHNRRRSPGTHASAMTLAQAKRIGPLTTSCVLNSEATLFRRHASADSSCGPAAASTAGGNLTSGWAQASEPPCSWASWQGAALNAVVRRCGGRHTGTVRRRCTETRVEGGTR